MRRLSIPCGCPAKRDVLSGAEMDAASEAEDLAAWVAPCKAKKEKGFVRREDGHARKSRNKRRGNSQALNRFNRRADVRNRCERFDFQINVDLAPAQVVHDHNIVALIRQIHGAGPAAEAVTTENENFHPKLLLKRSSRQSGASYYRVFS